MNRPKGVNFPSMNAVIHVGRVIELTEDDRMELYDLSKRLQKSLLEQRADVTKLVLAQFKIVQLAISRSHANPSAAHESGR